MGKHVALILGKDNDIGRGMCPLGFNDGVCSSRQDNPVDLIHLYLGYDISYIG